VRSVNSQRLFRNQKLVANVDIKASGKQMYVHKNIYHCNLPSHIISITNSRESYKSGGNFKKYFYFLGS
jgi:hypothetical protein